MKHGTVNIILFFFFMAITCIASSLTENDLDRIVYLRYPVQGYPECTFFVFVQLDEENKPLFEPLSGAQRKIKLATSDFTLTDYFRDTQPFEIALDAYYSYGMIQNVAFFYRAELLRVLGQQESIQSLLNAVQHFRDFNNGIEKLSRKYAEKLQEITEQSSKTTMATSCRFISSLPLKNKDDENKEDLEDLIDRDGKVLMNSVSAINAIIHQELSRHNVLAATSLYLAAENFLKKSLRMYRYKFLWDKQNLLAKLGKEIMTEINKTENEICQKIRDRYVNQSYKKAFLDSYPTARGLWSESPPSAGGLKRFFLRFYQIRKEMKQYKFSPILNFEQWGNCQLSLLLCTQGIPAGKYLEDDFLRELRRTVKKQSGNKKP